MPSNNTLPANTPQYAHYKNRPKTSNHPKTCITSHSPPMELITPLQSSYTKKLTRPSSPASPFTVHQQAFQQQWSASTLPKHPRFMLHRFIAPPAPTEPVEPPDHTEPCALGSKTLTKTQMASTPLWLAMSTLKIRHGEETPPLHKAIFYSTPS